MEFKGSTTTWTNTYKNTSGGWSSQGHVISSPANWHIYTAYLTKINTTDVRIEYWIDGVLKATHTGANFVGKRLISFSTIKWKARPALQVQPERLT